MKDWIKRLLHKEATKRGARRWDFVPKDVAEISRAAQKLGREREDIRAKAAEREQLAVNRFWDLVRCRVPDFKAAGAVAAQIKVDEAGPYIEEVL